MKVGQHKKTLDAMRCLPCQLNALPFYQYAHFFDINTLNVSSISSCWSLSLPFVTFDCRSRSSILHLTAQVEAQKTQTKDKNEDRTAMSWHHHSWLLVGMVLVEPPWLSWGRPTGNAKCQENQWSPCRSGSFAPIVQEFEICKSLPHCGDGKCISRFFRIVRGSGVELLEWNQRNGDDITGRFEFVIFARSCLNNSSPSSVRFYKANL